MPPLRARREDIGLLVEHFLGQVNARYGLTVRGVTPAALRLLERYLWRGNVRELEAVLEQAMILEGGEWIAPADLELTVRRRSGATEVPVAVEADGGSATTGTLSWLQREALRVVDERREVRRGDIVALCRISREVARRELVGLVRMGLLRRIGFGRGARYVPLAFWWSLVSDAVEWAAALL